MRTNTLLISTLALVASLAGCVKKQGSFDAQGYTHPEYEYRVLAGDPTSGKLMSEDWRLDNYFGPNNKAKRTPRYLTQYELDTDGDDKADKVDEALLYDLRFEHRRNAGLIWLRTFPVSDSLRDMDLRVMMREYVDALASSGYAEVSLQPLRILISNERLTTRVVRSAPGKLGPAESFEAIVEVADVEQMRLDPAARRKLAKLVLVRTDFEYGGKRKSATRFPVYMIAGYVNFPEDFERGLSDFDGLLDRVALGGQRGYRPAPTPPPVAAPPAPPPPASVPPEAPPPEDPVAPDELAPAE